MKDPGCSRSKGLAAVIVDAIRDGKSEKEALLAADNSNFGKAAEGKILSDAVKIPTDGAPAQGAANPKITLVEFSDFQCPYCIIAAGELHRVMDAYPNQVSLIFKQFPLDEHSQAALAAAASLAAQRQGKFWPMHDALFAQRGRLSPAVISGIAEKIGLDMKRFDADLHSPELQKIIVHDIEDGERAGVAGTPTLFVNGQRFNATLTLAVLKPVLDEELKKIAK
jgi:protein-disulfide isomerase